MRANGQAQACSRGGSRDRSLSGSKTWSKQAAIDSNKKVRSFGIERRGLVETELGNGLHRRVSGWDLAARALPAQRFGADIAGPVKPVAERPQGILPWL